MKKIYVTTTLFCLMGICCTNDSMKKASANDGNGNTRSEAVSTIFGRHYTGTFSNGMKGNKISFDISADGTKLENLTFQGYWYCNGKLEQTTAGPDGSFNIVNNKVDSHISEPPNGGATAWRFDLLAELKANKATGTFRMNINNLGCNTGKLNWTAQPQ